MPHTLIYPAGSTAACTYASEILQTLGLPKTDHPTPEITHLLLDVPSFLPNGQLRNGDDIQLLLSMLPEKITIVGGNLQHPALEGYRKLDLLQDADYLAENAAITAHCALQVAAPLIRTTFADTPALILGWGRIGKCLAQLLKGLHCPVSIAARKETDRATLHALGYDTVDFQDLPNRLAQYRLLFNTVPTPILSTSLFSGLNNCIKIELASTNVIGNDHTIIAKGLPGTYAPESSGKLIAQTFYRLWKEQKT